MPDKSTSLTSLKLSLNKLCPACQGDGWTVETGYGYDGEPEPFQVECEWCATMEGVILTILAAPSDISLKIPGATVVDYKLRAYRTLRHLLRIDPGPLLYGPK